MENLNYGMVGNGTTGALISRKGSVDWLCLPRFNSASVFARILDSDRGGVFEILTDPDYEIQQFYIRNTNILVTRFQQGENAFELIDFLPRYHENSHYYCPPDLVRYIRWISGTPEIKVNYDPRLEYAASPTQTTVHPGYIKSFTTRGPYVSVYLYSSFDYEKIVSGTLLRIEEDAYFLMSYNQQLLPQTVDRNYLKYERTKVYWLNWVERTRSFNRFNEEIIRSSLVLKMLSYQKSGAIIAALTTSLPETIGASRNWDYRFCWLRDASMAIKVLMHLGHRNAAERYIQFVIDLLPEKSEKIQIMYGINGEKTLTETTLDHLSGYQNSRPVRVGNDAYRQKQNDIFGVLMDVIFQQFKRFRVSLENSEELWTITRRIIRQ
ncbi:MAG: glycoside hydrolase family 15 protein, partial [Bacteroidales bacterium]|nr:glycoside hydrolase family 15 protein [Bacteroidales bacterium]